MRSTSSPRAATSVATRMSSWPPLSRADRAFALLLLHVAVQRRCGEAAGLEPLGELHRRLLGAGEHQHRVEGLGFEDTRERVELVHAAHDPVALADVRGRAGLALDRDLDRLAQVLLRDATDRRGHRRGEERDLARRGRLLEDPLDVVDETHLQHLVRLVEHEALDAAQVERAALDVIDHAARRADDDVRAALQARELRRVALAAVDRQHVEALDPRRVTLERLGHLDREFARRREHQGLRRAAPGDEATQHGQRESGGLAGAGLGLAQHVVAREEHGNGRGLDRRGRLVADLGQGLEHGGTQAQLGERRDDGIDDGWFHGDDSRDCGARGRREAYANGRRAWARAAVRSRARQPRRAGTHVRTL